MPIIQATHRALNESLAKALGLDMNYVRRVVIDIKSTEAVTVHVEMYGDASIIEVTDALAGVEISRVDSPPESV